MSISVPIFACADDTYAMPMPQFKLGESVPLVTSPMRSPLRKRRSAAAADGPFSFIRKGTSFSRGPILLLHQDIATDEVWFGQVDEESQSGLDRVSFRREIGTVKRVAHLQSQRIARAEATRLDSERLTLFKHGAPKLRRVLCGEENLNAILPGVTSAGDRNVLCTKWNINNVVSRRHLDVFTKECLEQRHGPWPLNGHCTKIRAATC